MKVEWTPPAELFLFGAAPTDAEVIVASMDLFASKRRGFVRRMLDEDGTLALYTGPFIVYFIFVDPSHIKVLEIRGGP
jgi:hypothetical protein